MAILFKSDEDVTLVDVILEFCQEGQSVRSCPVVGSLHDESSHKWAGANTNSTWCLALFIT